MQQSKTAQKNQELSVVKPLTNLQQSANGLFNLYGNKEQIHDDLTDIYDTYFSHMLGTGFDEEVIYRRQNLYCHLQKYIRSMEETCPLPPNSNL